METTTPLINQTFPIYGTVLFVICVLALILAKHIHLDAIHREQKRGKKKSFVALVEDVDATPYPYWAYVGQLAGGQKILRVTDSVERKQYGSRFQKNCHGVVIFILAHLHSFGGICIQACDIFWLIL
jgi:hypothetical protein